MRFTRITFAFVSLHLLPKWLLILFSLISCEKCLLFHLNTTCPSLNRSGQANPACNARRCKRILLIDSHLYQLTITLFPLDKKKKSVHFYFLKTEHNECWKLSDCLNGGGLAGKKLTVSSVIQGSGSEVSAIRGHCPSGPLV